MTIKCTRCDAVVKEAPDLEPRQVRRALCPPCAKIFLGDTQPGQYAIVFLGLPVHDAGGLSGQFLKEIQTMTTTLSDGKRVTLRFQYGVDKRKRRSTFAIVEDSEKKVLYIAQAVCSLKDRFVRATGRQEALKALYRRYKLPESDWKAIQAAYNNRTPKIYRTTTRVLDVMRKVRDDLHDLAQSGIV